MVDVKVVLVHRNDNKSDSLLKYAKSIMKLDPDMPVMLTHGTNVGQSGGRSISQIEVTISRASKVITLYAFSIMLTDPARGWILFGCGAEPTRSGRAVWLDATLFCCEFASSPPSTHVHVNDRG